MTDYSSYPTWWHKTDLDGETLVGDFYPKLLPLSAKTIQRLMSWQVTYDAILNWEDPRLSGFSTPEDAEAFEEEGIALWHIVREELKPDYHVAYFSWNHGLFENPEDLENEVNK